MDKALHQKALALHESIQGKLSTSLRSPVESMQDLALIYSPGVGAPCLEIAKNPACVYDYTGVSHTVAVISDGSAVLGLGNIGPKAALPVMEGKCALFKRFANIDAVPLVIDTQDTDEIIAFCKQVAPSFGGINLEDISAPRCVEIEEALEATLDIPVFHDDQHGTAIVTVAALINALKVVNKNPEDINVVISGTGAAGSAIIKLLNELGVAHVWAFNVDGIVTQTPIANTDLLRTIQSLTNKNDDRYSLAEAMRHADVFIGVSAPNIVSPEMVQSMRKDPIVFAMANPDPEIHYDDAKAAGARVVGTGRSDMPNQINNLLVFPGLFKGLLTARATHVPAGVKLTVAHALASLIENPSETNIIPSVFDERVVNYIAEVVQKYTYNQNHEE